MSASARGGEIARVDGWVWPTGLRPPARLAETQAGELVVRHPRADGESARALVASLRGAAAGLAAIPAAELVEILGAGGEALIGDLDGDAVRLVAANARMSPAMVAEIVDGMAASWNGDALRRLVEAEFADPRVLDGFVAEGGRAVRAAGPGLALHLGAGAVPGVTVTAMIRALLVKSAVLAKPGAGDVVLARRFARTLQRIDARVGAAVAVQYWPGGGEGWEGWERELFRAVDQIVVYGSDATIEAVRARAPASTRLVEHAHRVGVAVVDPRGALDSASQAARAAVLFDQRGCVSTQLVFVLGDGRRVRRWCAALAGELAALEEALPPGGVDPAALSSLHQLRGRLRMKRAASADAGADGTDAAGRGAAGADADAIELWHAEASRWTVVLAPASAFEPVGERTVWVVAAPNLNTCLQALAPLAPVLQSVGLVGIDEDRDGFAAALSGLGVTRLVPLLRVPYPEADWMHDGNRPLGELVRWCELR